MRFGSTRASVLLLSTASLTPIRAVRARFEGVQDFTGQGKGNQSIWLVYHNINETTTHRFDCTKNDSAIISPFPANITVKNLFFPHDEYDLEESPEKLGFDGSSEFNGCVPELKLEAYGFKAFVPKDEFVPPPPMITRFSPGHDARLVSEVPAGSQETIDFEIDFSAAMDCDSIKSSLQIDSTTDDKRLAQLDLDSARCEEIDDPEPPKLVGEIVTAFRFSARLFDVSNGIHAITVRNVSTEDGVGFTNAVDRFLFRVGQPDNPMVFPKTANYTRDVLHDDGDGRFHVTHKAAGADQFRYSLDWGSSWSEWLVYDGKNTDLAPKKWSGTKRQRWDDEHVVLQYWYASSPMILFSGGRAGAMPCCAVLCCAVLCCAVPLMALADVILMTLGADWRVPAPTSNTPTCRVKTCRRGDSPTCLCMAPSTGTASTVASRTRSISRPTVAGSIILWRSGPQRFRSTSGVSIRTDSPIRRSSSATSTETLCSIECRRAAWPRRSSTSPTHRRRHIWPIASPLTMATSASS